MQWELKVSEWFRKKCRYRQRTGFRWQSKKPGIRIMLQIGKHVY